jgi:hypothetical protein
MKTRICLLLALIGGLCYGQIITDADGKKEITKQGDITITVLLEPSQSYINAHPKLTQAQVLLQKQARDYEILVSTTISQIQREQALVRLKSEGKIAVDSK